MGTGLVAGGQHRVVGTAGGSEGWAKGCRGSGLEWVCMCGSCLVLGAGSWHGDRELGCVGPPGVQEAAAAVLGDGAQSEAREGGQSGAEVLELTGVGDLLGPAAAGSDPLP